MYTYVENNFIEINKLRIVYQNISHHCTRLHLDVNRYIFLFKLLFVY